MQNKTTNTASILTITHRKIRNKILLNRLIKQSIDFLFLFFLLTILLMFLNASFLKTPLSFTTLFYSLFLSPYFIWKTIHHLPKEAEIFALIDHKLNSRGVFSLSWSHFNKSPIFDSSTLESTLEKCKDFATQIQKASIITLKIPGLPKVGAVICFCILMQTSMPQNNEITDSNQNVVMNDFKDESFALTDESNKLMEKDFEDFTIDSIKSEIEMPKNATLESLDTIIKDDQFIPESKSRVKQNKSSTPQKQKDNQIADEKRAEKFNKKETSQQKSSDGSGSKEEQSKSNFAYDAKQNSSKKGIQEIDFTDESIEKNKGQSKRKSNQINQSKDPYEFTNISHPPLQQWSITKVQSKIHPKYHELLKRYFEELKTTN